MVPRLGYVCIHVQIDWLSIYTTTVRLNDCERAMKRCRYRQTERQRDGQRDICRLANSFDSGSWSNRNLEPIIQMQKQARHACTAISLALCSYCFVVWWFIKRNMNWLTDLQCHKIHVPVRQGSPLPSLAHISTGPKHPLQNSASLIDRHRYYSSK